MNKFAHMLTGWLSDAKVIEEQEKELYEYATYCLLMNLSPLLLAILFGCFMGQLRESILLIIPFMMVRKYSGGYHAKHPLICLFASCLLLGVCIILACSVKYDIRVIIILLIAYISLAIHSPIDSENRRLDRCEIQRYKKTTIKITTLFVIISLVLAYVGQYKFAMCIAIGIILTFGLQIPCIVNKYVQKNK